MDNFDLQPPVLDDGDLEILLALLDLKCAVSVLLRDFEIISTQRFNEPVRTRTS